MLIYLYFGQINPYGQVQKCDINVTFNYPFICKTTLTENMCINRKLAVRSTKEHMVHRLEKT